MARLVGTRARPLLAPVLIALILGVVIGMVGTSASEISPTGLFGLTTNQAGINFAGHVYKKGTTTGVGGVQVTASETYSTHAYSRQTVKTAADGSWSLTVRHGDGNSQFILNVTPLTANPPTTLSSCDAGPAPFVNFSSDMSLGIVVFDNPLGRINCYVN